MASEIRFFATKADLLSISQEIEGKISIKYFMTGAYSSLDEVKGYKKLVEYEDLGINKSGDHQNESFLVVEETDPINIRDIFLFDGHRRCLVDQLKNEHSIVLWPGGIYGDKFLVHGHVATIHTDITSKKLYAIFQKAIKKHCSKKIGSFYVSPDAINLYKNNFRLITINVRQSPEYDLQIL